MIFTVAVGVVLASAVVVASGYPLRASILILIMGGLGLVLVAMELVRGVRAQRRAGDAVTAGTAGAAAREQPKGGGIMDTPRFASERTTREQALATAEFWAWYGGLLAAIWLLGFRIGVPLFAFAYCRSHGGSWIAAASLAAILTTIIIGIFSVIMGTPWPTPQLFELFDR